jgi:hypothetical protein
MAKTASQSKANFRAAFFGAKDHRKKEVVQWKAPDGATYPVEVIEPTAKQRGQIRKSAMKLKGDDIEFDQTAMEVWAIIFCAHDPDSGEPLFDASDYDTLLNMGGGSIDALSRPCMKFMGQTTPEEEAGN